MGEREDSGASATPGPSWRAVLCLALVATAAVAALTPSPLSAQDDGSATDPELELAQRYSPIIVLKSQDGECDRDGEPFAPSSVDIVLDNPQVALRQVGNGEPVVMWGPSAAELFGLGEGFYLDFPGDALDPGCVYERDFRRFGGDADEVTVYAHVVPDPTGGRLALQYWFWWYYNDWNNRHESDWEGIQLLFEVGTVAEALSAEPVSVGYAQHEGAESADWDSNKLERDGTHPLVYSSAGSHASYFGSAVYLGRSGAEGFGCDTTDSPSDVRRSDVVLLPSSINDPGDDLAWLGFEGRWGERGGGPFNGPTGPAAKDRWTDPFAWHEELRSSSVVVPAGDGAADVVVRSFCDVVEWGSRQLITLQRSPVRLGLVVLAAFLLIRALIRRTSWSPVTVIPLRRRRRAGEAMRAAGHLYRSRPALMVQLGSLYLPIAVVAGAVASLLSLIPLVEDLLGVAGRRSEVRVALALLASGVANLLAHVFVNAAVASGLADIESTGSTSWRRAFEVVRRKWLDLARGFVRAGAIVVVLLLTVVGIPWAIRQLVRYQFLAQAVVLDDLDDRASLARSSALVRGRWGHTALVTIAFNTLLGAGGLTVGLLLLLLVPSLPMFVFSALVTVIYAIVSTYVAVCVTLVYGDAVAEHEGLQRADGRGVADRSGIATTA